MVEVRSNLYPVGTIISKEFVNYDQPFRGKIESVREVNGVFIYFVKYDDGDSEEMTQDDLKDHVLLTKSSKLAKRKDQSILDNNNIDFISPSLESNISTQTGINNKNHISNNEEEEDEKLLQETEMFLLNNTSMKLGKDETFPLGRSKRKYKNISKNNENITYKKNNKSVAEEIENPVYCQENPYKFIRFLLKQLIRHPNIQHLRHERLNHFLYDTKIPDKRALRSFIQHDGLKILSKLLKIYFESKLSFSPLVLLLKIIILLPGLTIGLVSKSGIGKQIRKINNHFKENNYEDERNKEDKNGNHQYIVYGLSTWIMSHWSDIGKTATDERYNLSYTLKDSVSIIEKKTIPLIEKKNIILIEPVKNVVKEVKQSKNLTHLKELVNPMEEKKNVLGDLLSKHSNQIKPKKSHLAPDWLRRKQQLKRERLRVQVGKPINEQPSKENSHEGIICLSEITRNALGTSQKIDGHYIPSTTYLEKEKEDLNINVEKDSIVKFTFTRCCTFSPSEPTWVISGKMNQEITHTKHKSISSILVKSSKTILQDKISKP